MPKISKSQLEALNSINSAGSIRIIGLNIVEGPKVKIADIDALYKAGFIGIKHSKEDDAPAGTTYEVTSFGKEQIKSAEQGGLVGQWCIYKRHSGYTYGKVLKERFRKSGYGRLHEIAVNGWTQYRGGEWVELPSVTGVTGNSSVVGFKATEDEAKAACARLEATYRPTNRMRGRASQIKTEVENIARKYCYEMEKAALDGTELPSTNLFNEVIDLMQKAAALEAESAIAVPKTDDDEDEE